MKTVIRYIGILTAIGVSLQFIHPSLPTATTRNEIVVPPHIHQILEKDCYACHSNENRLEWWDEVQPGYWLVRKDVLEARDRLNFSTIGSKPAAAQRAALYEGLNLVQLGAMPLPRFVALHHGATVTNDELVALRAYLAPWTVALPDVSSTVSPLSPSRVSLDHVKEEFNGVSLDPSFENWRPLSFTDRGDNNSFRVVLGNAIAERAVAEGKISPWPDGARIVKIGWQKQTAPDDTVRPAAFIQAEFMYKDARKFSTTDGWGWGRWRSLMLEPYGKDAGFVKECTGCHQPVKGNDYVYTLPITTRHVAGVEVVNNAAAALYASLPYQPLQWSPITLLVDPAKQTISALFGNQRAMQAVRSAHGKSPAYGAGAVVSLVTWKQRDDPHWFGARIPATPIAVEFLTRTDNRSTLYERFSGAELIKETLNPAEKSRREELLLNMHPLELP